MPVSCESIPDDRQLVRYLVGLLPEEEAERLDEQSIVLDEVAARLRCVENDLVDAYVRGALEGEILERFEVCYLASPRRREKVEFAERFLGAVDGTPTPEVRVSPTTPPGADQTPYPATRSGAHARVVSRSRLVWSLAAAAILLLTCGILFVQDVGLRRGLSDAQREVAAAGSHARALAGQLDGQRAANDSMTKELDRLRAAPPIAAIALVLVPQTRAAGPVPVIALAPGSGMAAFDLELEATDFARYEVALKDPRTNQIVWRSDTLTPRLSRRPAAVAVAVPVTVLKPQHYSLELSGRNAAGVSEIIGSYAFQVQSR